MKVQQRKDVFSAVKLAVEINISSKGEGILPLEMFNGFNDSMCKEFDGLLDIEMLIARSYM